jgi:hypothetical protein
MELLGGNFNIINKGNLGIVPSPVLNSDHLSHDEPIALTVDSFTNSDSRSPLEEMANQLERYTKVMDIDDPEQVVSLKNYKALLEEMRRNLEAGKTTPKKLNEYILGNEFIQAISERIEDISKTRSTWLALTGSEQPSGFNDETNPNKIQVTQKIQDTRNQVIKDLESASPEKIAALMEKQEAATKANGLLGDKYTQVTRNGLEKAYNEANKTAQDNLRADISDLEKELKNPNLTNEERQSSEQRIEKIKKTIEILDKIKDDPEFKKKIWSKLSPEEQERLLEDIKNKKLTEESLQAINRATAAADETQTINEGFFASSKQRMKKMTGLTHEEYYEKYRVPMNLDKSEFIKTNIDLKVYSRDSAYDSSSYYSNNEKDPKNSNLSLEQKVEDMISELESRGELTPAEQNLTNKDIAQRLGLKPDHPIVLAIARGEYDSARELSIGLNLETSVNAIAPENAIASGNQGLRAWLSFSNSVIPTHENNLEKKFLNLNFS